MSEEKDNREDSATDDVQEVNFKYMKSNFYRVIHTNGAFGGISGRGEIHIGIYSERLEFPDSSKLLVSSKGPLGREEFEGIGSIVREIEADLVVDLQTAMQIRRWLDHKITEMKELIKEAQKEAASRAKQIAIPEA